MKEKTNSALVFVLLFYRKNYEGFLSLLAFACPFSLGRRAFASAFGRGAGGRHFICLAANPLSVIAEDAVEFPAFLFSGGGRGFYSARSCRSRARALSLRLIGPAVRGLFFRDKSAAREGGTYKTILGAADKILAICQP